MKKILFTLVITFYISYIIAQPTAGLVSYWPLNGNLTSSGPTVINIANTNVTATTNISGTASTAMAFNNPTGTVASYGTVTANAALNFTGDFSIDFSFYINSPYVHPMGFFDNGINQNASTAFGYGVWYWNSGGSKLVFNCRNGSVQTSLANPIPLATWMHATFVRAAGTLKIYVNGILNASGPEGTNTLGYTGVIPKLGTMTYLFQSPQEYNGLHGKMDELRIYNRALTDAEILQLNTLLPVKLTSFTANKTNADINLQWQTEYEQNSSHFNIQRSIDGVDFSTIATVTAKGNSSLPTTYQFIDNTAKSLVNVKTVFYRLQMVDIDASKVNSAIVAVKLQSDKKELTILQNPVGNELRIQFTAAVKETGYITITDAAGRQLLTRQIQLKTGTISTVIPVTALAAGNYYITVTSAQGKQTKTFLKQ